ncbi:MAG TPA: gamma-glutamyl-gamma-aminobutyrate hydrolase family protein, partial [Candidatus Methanofastidiosa archaeon]|nr:gamma-glutamyl-gamma-aminobutyrate hydrolase family protein [Candidatus Methanofastidiosa archaeon]
LYIIRNIPIPILGICAGMQSISLAYGGAAYEWCDIGLKNISVVKEDNLLGERRVFQGYHLHSHGVTLPENFVTLAEKDGHVMAFRSVEQEIYGVLFHPEVRNEWIIENFLKM